MLEAELRRKNDFTISCDAGSGLEISDGDGRKGGNVASRRGSRISWTNATGRDCRLAFRQLLGDDGGPGTDDWPFKVTPQHPLPADRQLAIPAGARVERSLTDDYAEHAYFEYVVLDAAGAPLHDPVIIIEP